LILSEIGKQLDQNIFPYVENGGIVMPNKTAKPLLTMGEVNSNDSSKRQNRSKTRSREGATRRKGQTREHGTTNSATPVILSGLEQIYFSEIDAILEAYPGTQIWKQEEGMWLLSYSSLVTDTMDDAAFLCAIPFLPITPVRSWGFWNATSWIGPRHTNLPDGSICAFEPSDGTWLPGDSIIKLLDIYSLWAVRHLYLQRFGYWPGAQVAHYPYERLIEQKENELCGCGSLFKSYGECCKPKDLKRNKITDAINFISLGGAKRQPPEKIMRFIKEKNNPPSILNL